LTKVIDEASGLVCSRSQKDICWMMGDARGGGNGIKKVYAINISKPKDAVVSCDVNAENRDWEDISIRGDHLYISEIGDNDYEYRKKTIYKFKEPDVSDGCKSKIDVEATTFTSPIGNFNAESFFVAPNTGTMYVLTKASKGKGRILSIEENTEGTKKAKDLGKVNLAGDKKPMTGADISPDGSKMAVRTGSMVHVYHRVKQGKRRSIEDTLEAGPECSLKHEERQGEAIAFSADGKKLYTVSEGVGMPVYEFDLK